MVTFLKLIRWQNIAMMAITLYAMRYLVIWPALVFPEIGLHLELSFLHFNLLVLSTLLIAASGYLINDYFDLKIDRFNKPEKMILGTHISRKWAIKWHWILTIFGLLTAFYISYLNQSLALFYVFLFVSGALWFYSTSYKHIPLLGNTIIALLVALIPIVISFLDLLLVNRNQKALLIESGYQLTHTFYLLLGFAGFAFLYNLVREIVKDMADVQGDKQSNSRSIPVAWGMQTAKYLSIALLFIGICLLSYVDFQYLSDVRSSLYIHLVLIIPSIYALYKISAAKGREQYLSISLLLKGILFFGILYSLVFYMNLMGL